MYGLSAVGRFSATTTLARKTSAATAFLAVEDLLGVLDLMDSLRRFTDERETRRRGLSLERRMGPRFWGVGVGEEGGP